MEKKNAWYKPILTIHKQSKNESVLMSCKIGGNSGPGNNNSNCESIPDCDQCNQYLQS